MPFMLENTRWNSEPSRPTGNEGVTLGCRTPWPATTRPAVGVEARPIERVRHFADQPADRVARQPGVGVERDDVADAVGHRWRLPAEAQEAGVGRAAQQPVQLMQLAALAFPADPPRLAAFQTRLRCSSRKRSPPGAGP